MRQTLRDSLSSLSPFTPFPIPPYPSPAHCELPFLLIYIYYCSISCANKTINKYIILFSPLSSQMLVYSKTVLLFFFLTQQYILEISPASTLGKTLFFLQLHCTPRYRCALLERSVKHPLVRIAASPSLFLPHLCVKTCPSSLNTDLL